MSVSEFEKLDLGQTDVPIKIPNFSPGKTEILPIMIGRNSLTL